MDEVINLLPMVYLMDHVLNINEKILELLLNKYQEDLLVV
jgi:hypothetical protein